MQAEREAFEKWVRKMFVCSEHSFVRAHPFGYINTVSSQTFEGRVQPSYADVQMLWETWLGRAAAGVAGLDPAKFFAAGAKDAQAMAEALGVAPTRGGQQ